MKTKSFLGLLLSMALLIGLTACSKDDDKGGDDDSASIVGTWSLIHSEGYEKENGKKTNTWDEECDGELEWTFKSNGTVTFWEDGQKYMAAYTYKNNKLTIGDEEEGAIVFNIPKLTSSTLVMEMNMKEDGYELYDKSTYEKVE